MSSPCKANRWLAPNLARVLAPGGGLRDSFAVARVDSAQLLRVLSAVSDPAVRVSYVESLLRERAPEELAAALDAICRGAEQAEEASRKALVSIVLACASPALGNEVQRLREEAVGCSLLALERVLREAPEERAMAEEETNEHRNPDYGTGRPLTLGERKSLARKPNAEMLPKLLLDPHPDVIEQLLVNPALTEDLVVRLVTKRPCPPEILQRVARATKWAMRPRIRLALVLNPSTPRAIAASFVGLLIKQELKLVAESANVSREVRVLCLEHLERRPPGEDSGEGTLQ